MSRGKFFPPRPDARPTIYAYEDTNPQYLGLLKVGYTTIDAQTRVAQQYPTLKPGKPPYRIVFEESAMRNDGSAFSDRDVHRHLRRVGVKNPEGEWFRCSAKEVKAAVIALCAVTLNLRITTVRIAYGRVSKRWGKKLKRVMPRCWLMPESV